MRVISNRALVAFAVGYPQARAPLQAWRRTVQSRAFHGFADLKASFGAVDRVGQLFVFDIGGNKFRLVAAIHFDRQTLYVRHVLTHGEYDKWTP